MEAELKAIVGLGNPGEKYAKTRHNAGFWLIERLAVQHGGALKAQSRLHGLYGQIQVRGQSLHLLMPTTFMNASGRSIRALLDFYKLQPDQILVVHDELDLPAGTVRLKRGGGAGGHNGLKDSIACLGNDFPRLRVGIGHPGDREKVLSYVLSPPSKLEATSLEHAVDDSCRAVEDWLDRGWDFAVNRLHSIKNT
ncbi:MAG: aminoacyl-tRNA hydrolase [Oceanococcus sp.]